MLADMARHVSDALLAARIETDRVATLDEICGVMMRELGSPTSGATGDYKQTKQ